MVVIRLARAGTKKKPFYHLSVMDKRSARDGRFIERVGFYNPIARGKSEQFRVDLERVDYWSSVGAQISPKVASIIKKARKQGPLTETLEPEPEVVTATELSETTESVVDAESEASVVEPAADADAVEAEVDLEPEVAIDDIVADETEVESETAVEGDASPAAATDLEDNGEPEVDDSNENPSDSKD